MSEGFQSTVKSPSAAITHSGCHFLQSGGGTCYRLTRSNFGSDLIECAKGGQEPTNRQKKTSGQLYLIDSAPITGTESLYNIREVPHNESDTGKD